MPIRLKLNNNTSASHFFYHPDKHKTQFIDKEDITFHQIQYAYDILCNPDTRKEYNYKLKETEINKQFLENSFSEVDLDDMTFLANDSSFNLECRCGGKYCITENDLEHNIDLVQCSHCSLSIRVLYERAAIETAYT